MSDLLSNDKKSEISAPYNPIHLTHVGFNTDTGEFTVSSTRFTHPCKHKDYHITVLTIALLFTYFRDCRVSGP